MSTREVRRTGASSPTPRRNVATPAAARYAHPVLGLQRSLGNRAVAALIRRAPAAPAAPAPAAGVSAPSPPVPQSDVSAAESAPVQLPPTASDLSVTFSSAPRKWQLAVPDLKALAIGKGELETPPLPAAEWLSVKAKIGADEGARIAEAAVVLSPIAGKISAGEVERARNPAAGTGTVGAALGGIAGGLYGAAWGAVGGIPGMIAGAKHGAAHGGVIGGKAQETAMELFAGRDVELAAVLEEGELGGVLKLAYSPWIELSLAATGFTWLADVNARLRTTVSLALAPGVSLRGSSVRLHFVDGRLARTVFTLAPTVKFGIALDAMAQLIVSARALPILDGKAFGGEGRSPGADDATVEDAGVSLAEIASAPFPLCHAQTTIERGASLQLAKGSPLEVLSTVFGFGERTAIDLLAKNVRKGGDPLPTARTKPPAAAATGEAPSGLTEADPIPMAWHKPIAWYPTKLRRPHDAKGSTRIIRMFPHRALAGGLEIGVDGAYWPWVGKPLAKRPSARGSGVAKFQHALRENQIELDEQLAYKADIDHVQDVFWGGPDDATNLWPLHSSANRQAGTTQNRNQKVTWAYRRGGPPRETPIAEVPNGRHFVVREIKAP